MNIKEALKLNNKILEIQAKLNNFNEQLVSNVDLNEINIILSHFDTDTVRYLIEANLIKDPLTKVVLNKLKPYIIDDNTLEIEEELAGHLMISYSEYSCAAYSIRTKENVSILYIKLEWGDDEYSISVLDTFVWCLNEDCELPDWVKKVDNAYEISDEVKSELEV